MWELAIATFVVLVVCVIAFVHGSTIVDDESSPGIPHREGSDAHTFWRTR